MIGDHLRALKGGRWTHAIDCGDETVILLADYALVPPRVRRGYRPEFVGGADAVEVVRHRERTFPADEVVARAYSRISDPALAAMFRDSEAFAGWCTTGRIPSAPRNVAAAARADLPAPAGRPPAGRPARRPRKEARVAPGAGHGARKTKPARTAAGARTRAKAARGAARGRAGSRSGTRKGGTRKAPARGTRRGRR